MKRLPVIEIFGPTLQGEGSVIGLKTLFVRLAGCDCACRWCDSKYTWQKGAMAPVTWLEPAAIRAELERLGGGCWQLTISGGNPALHDLRGLIGVLQQAPGYRIQGETQGSLAPAWLSLVDQVTASPKGPSSGMATDWAALAQTLERSRAAEVLIGAGALDYSGYPDCRPESIAAFAEAVRLGTKAGAEGRGLRIRTPLIELSKAEIVRLASRLGAPLHLMHSCYLGTEPACGQCDACLLRLKGFREAGMADPVPYAVRH